MSLFFKNHNEFSSQQSKFGHRHLLMRAAALVLAGFITTGTILGCSQMPAHSSSTENTQAAGAPAGSSGNTGSGTQDAASGTGGASSAGDTLLTLPYGDSDEKQSASAYDWICSDLVENVSKLNGLTETDDFHAAVNREWLQSNSIPSGYVSYDAFAERQLEVDKELQAILKSDQEIDDPYIAHCKKLVQDYYTMWLDWDARNAAGVEPLRDVVAPLIAVQSLDDMTKYLSDPDTTVRALPLCGAFTAANPNDADKNAVYISPPSLVFQDPMYYDYLDANSWKTQPRYMEAAGYMLERLGYSEQERDKILKDSYTFECEMASSMMTTAESNAEDAAIRCNNPRTLQELEKEQGAFPLTGMLAGAGVEQSEVFILEEPEWLACMSGLYDDAHLEKMKAYLLVSDVLQFMELLDRPCYDRMNAVRNTLSGSSGQVDDEKAATDAVNDVLEMELGEVYAETYITDKTRSDVTALIEDVVAYYRSMLQGEDFLSDATKAEAIKKLDSLTIRVASPEDHEEEEEALEAIDSAASTEDSKESAGSTDSEDAGSDVSTAPAEADSTENPSASADPADSAELSGTADPAAAADTASADDSAAAETAGVAGIADTDGTVDAADTTDTAEVADTSAPADTTETSDTAVPADNEAGTEERILDFKGPDEGGSLVDARIAISEDTCLAIAERVNQPVDRDQWLASPQDVNAYYYPLDNSINIPAGILGGIFYRDQMSREEKLGHVGIIVAHEMSHAFDTSGRQYDEHGNLRNWWTEEDYIKFHERAQKLVDYYNGFEPISGYPINGAMIDTEAIADLTGVKCMLRIAADDENFDYDRFFRTLAANWRTLTTLETEAYSIEQDSHPLAYLRTNAVVVQFEEFHKTYGTKEGDGMYLAPEYRLEIW